MELRIQNPNSPQVKFTPKTEETLLQFRAYVKKMGDKKISYKEFQDIAESMKITTAKYVRTEFAFFLKSGLINDYSFITNNLFTDLGEAYCKTIENIQLLKMAPESEQKNALLKKSLETRQYILRITVKNMTESKNCDYGKVLKRVLNFLVNFDSINETEFALILDQMKLQPTIPISETKNVIEKYREDSSSLSFKVKVNSKKTGKVELSDSTNCYSYYTGILEEAGFISIEKGRSYINKELKEQIMKTYGGKYE